MKEISFHLGISAILEFGCGITFDLKQLLRHAKDEEKKGKEKQPEKL